MGCAVAEQKPPRDPPCLVAFVEEEMGAMALKCDEAIGAQTGVELTQTEAWRVGWLFNFARRVLTMVPEAQLRMALVETEPFLISPEITVPMGCGPSCPHTHPPDADLIQHPSASHLRVVK